MSELTLEQSRRGLRAARVVLTVLAALLLVAGLYWILGAEQRAINAMEPGKRTTAFQQSYASFELMCGEYPSEALMANCRRQARFLKHFPECGVACRAEVSRYSGTPTR
jgi:cbb3-type cytochrome oxidase subunit 3